MAVLTGAQVIPKYIAGDAEQVVLFALKNVNPGDTIDLATIGNNASFLFIYKAVVVTGAGQAGIAATAGTVVTMPAALPANAAGYLTVVGC
jgi:hypothetical protein